MAAALHIAEEPAIVHHLVRQHHIRWAARIRIDRNHRNHVPDLEIWVDLFADFDGQSAGDQFIVPTLVHRFFRIRIIAKVRTGVGPPEDVVLVVHLVVDFIESHPIFHFIFVALEADFCKFDEEIHSLAIHEAAVFFGQMIRHLEVGKRDDRFDSVFQ